MNPAPYPLTNTAELQSLNLLRSLLDPQRVKPTLAFNDKTPNTDGHLEIVDDHQFPIGKIEVQVKSIPKNAVSFQCPLESIAYSQRISLPFLLICVDAASGKAYFRHLHPGMAPVMPPGQKSFSLKFDPIIHAITNETQYIQQWVAIIEDYNKRVSDYPRISQLAKQIKAENISKNDLIYFQQFIEHVNKMLDGDFPIVHEQCFKGVWKLGVAVSSADPLLVAFQIYTIQPGEPDIRVTGALFEPLRPHGIPNTPEVVSVWAQDPSRNISYYWKQRSVLKPPKEEASEIVLNHLSKMIRAKTLPLRSARLAVEYLFWFVDNYGQSLGIDPADRLKVSDLNFGIYVYLPAWATVAVPRFLGEVLRLYGGQCPPKIAHIFIAPPFESVACVYPNSLRPSKEEVNALIKAGQPLGRTRLQFTEVSLNILKDSIDILSNAGVEWIERPYKQAAPGGPFIWSGYTPDALRHNIHSVITGAVGEYRTFIEGNRLPLTQSLYLNEPCAIVYVANFQAWAKSANFMGPELTRYIVKNSDGKLPRVTLIDIGQSHNALVTSKESLKLENLEREIVARGSESASDFFKKLPLLERMYAMLQDDLRHAFGHV